jgi:DNA-binding LacI/PurR family transcriptional regulator
VSGKGSVSPATLEKVKKAIDELGFRPSHAARTLLTGTSQMIGVYIPVLSGTFYTPILQIIDTELRAAGLHMVVAFGVGLGDERKQAKDGIQFLMERGCDGLIVMTSALQDEDIAALGTQQGRIVVLNHSLASIPDQCFTVDHKLGGRLAARALLDHKHRDIATWSGSRASWRNCRMAASIPAACGLPRATFRRPAAGRRPRSWWNRGTAAPPCSAPTMKWRSERCPISRRRASAFRSTSPSLPTTIRQARSFLRHA